MKNQDLVYKKQNIWDQADEKTREEIFALAKDYRKFLDASKTERWASREIVKRAQEAGFVNIEEKTSLKPGDRVYKVNKEKTVALFVIGQDPLIDGMNIIGSHMDSPRLDLKQVPLYEEGGMAYFKTHYYGGIKKYQWLASPLELHGVVINSQGERLDIVIGEDEDDPVMYITDLLPHLAKDQMAKKAGDFVDAEDLNILVGSIAAKDGEKDLVKENILKILNQKYGLVEEDFVSAELEVVPHGSSKDVGLDRSMIMGYGHDDRACVYASLEAILETKNPKRTSLAFFVDKEEIGSTGNTGMSSKFIENLLVEIVQLTTGDYNTYMAMKALENSYALSADVAACYDPSYKNAYELSNSAELNKGVSLVKYTGSRGKSGSSDANPEFVAYVRNLLNQAGVIWQTAELGKTDQGGGGTIAYILAEYGMEVLDCGVGVLSMHAPYELISKADLFMTYRAYKSFYKG